MGTPNELTNQEGQVIWLADYEAWGETRIKMCWGHILASQGESYARVNGEDEYVPSVIYGIAVSADELQPLRFQGQYIDQETGLHYNRFRYYDADIGMFISRDPIGLLGGVNVFAYAPNPTGWIDPWGLNPCNDTKKLQQHAADTKAHINSLPNRNMTQKQLDSVDRSLERAEIAQNKGDIANMNEHLNRAVNKDRRYVGQRMDADFKKRVESDPSLNHLTVSKSGQAAPDVYNADKTKYWDLTTQQSWKGRSHQRKYDGAGKFGSGTPLYWD